MSFAMSVIHTDGGLNVLSTRFSLSDVDFDDFFKGHFFGRSRKGHSVIHFEADSILEGDPMTLTPDFHPVTISKLVGNVDVVRPVRLFGLRVNSGKLFVVDSWITSAGKTCHVHSPDKVSDGMKSIFCAFCRKGYYKFIQCLSFLGNTPMRDALQLGEITDFSHTKKTTSTIHSCSCESRKKTSITSGKIRENLISLISLKERFRDVSTKEFYPFVYMGEEWKAVAV